MFAGNSFQRALSLVVALRLWRVFIIVNELSETSSEQFNLLTARIEQLEHENEGLRKELISANILVSGSPEDSSMEDDLRACHSTELGSLI